MMRRFQRTKHLRMSTKGLRLNRKRPLRVIGVLLIILALAGLFWQRDVNSAPGFPVPKNGQAYYGVQLAWGNDSIPAYAQRLGRTPALYGIYVDYPLSATDEQAGTAIARQLAPRKSTLMLTLEPWGGLSSVTPDNLARLTKDLQTWNNQGTPVLVRFAHEMDGSWYPWCQQPVQYIQTFRMVADAVHKAPASAILWSPNEGGGYPFAGGTYAAQPGSPDFRLLDTNHDSQLTMSDDPYAPFYPGDQYVDWVGLSVYHFGKVWPWGENNVPDAGKLEAKITGTYQSRYVEETALPDFYADYAAGHNKPFAISETGALYIPTRTDGASGLAIKTAWMRQAFDSQLTTRFPNLKLVAWFEHEKRERDTEPSSVDWRITNDAAIRDTFKGLLPEWLLFGR